jgi:hypothetical protein
MPLWLLFNLSSQGVQGVRQVETGAFCMSWFAKAWLHCSIRCSLASTLVTRLLRFLGDAWRVLAYVKSEQRRQR